MATEHVPAPWEAEPLSEDRGPGWMSLRELPRGLVVRLIEYELPPALWFMALAPTSEASHMLLYALLTLSFQAFPGLL